MAAGAVAETVAVELEQVASDVSQVAAATRRLDGRVLGSLWIGIGVGAAVGIYVGYKYSKRKLRNEIYAEIAAEAEQDIEIIRENYQKKIIASMEQNKAKSVEEIVRERGYETSENEDHTSVVQSDPPVIFPPEVGMTSSRREVPEMINVDPYLISEKEFLPNESGFSQVNYTYYSGDDVLIDDADPTNILSGREELLGDDAVSELIGSTGFGTIYVSNPNLQLEMLVEYVPKSWDEEVAGLDRESG